MACCDSSVYSGTDWGKQIECLKCEIEALSKEIKSLSKGANDFSSEMGKSRNIANDMLTTIGDMRKRMFDFTTDTTKQYQLAESIAKSYKAAALEIGISTGRAKGFSEAFKGSVASVAKFGGDLTDVQGIYQDFADKSGRVRILGDDEVENIFKLSKSANLVGSEASSLYESFELMGTSNIEATERMSDLIIDSQKMGLNSSKVVKTLATNMKSMQGYSFANGVKGMTEMAKLGVKMRLEVSDMLAMAGKFYEPEAAIEAVANLQMLGGDIANAFGDPFEIMYLARNKPEELSKKLGSMVENMMQFNEESGEYEFPAEARMQLKAAGDQLGFNVDQLIDMTRQTNKMKDVKDKLSIKGMFSEDEMEGIASMARLEGGQFKVDVYDEDGKKIAKSLDELSKGDVEMLMGLPKDEKDYQGQMIHQSMTTNELLKSIEDTFQKTFVGGVDIYQITEDSTKETIEAVRKLTLKSTETMFDSVEKSFAGEMGGFGKEVLQKTDETMANLISKIKPENFIIKKPEQITINGDNIKINVPTTSERQDIGGGNKDTSVKPPGTENNQIKPFAKGGIVTKPTRALIGEAGEAEAVFPLSKLENFIQTQKMSGKVTLEGTSNININISSDNPTLDLTSIETSLKTKIENMIVSHLNGTFRNGGVPSSKEASDYMG